MRHTVVSSKRQSRMAWSRLNCQHFKIQSRSGSIRATSSKKFSRTTRSSWREAIDWTKFCRNKPTQL